MTDFQTNLIVNTYFETLIDEKINEKDVNDFYQKEGYLYILLNDNSLIKKTIKNLYNDRMVFSNRDTLCNL